MGKRSGKNRAQGRALKQKPSLLDVWMELLLGGFLALYLLFIPLRGSERLGMYSQISETKTTLFFVLMGILLFYGAIRLGVELWAWRKQGKPLTSLSPSQIAALLFLFFTVISAAASPYQANAWYSSKSHEATLTLGLYVLLFLVTSRWGVPTRRLWKVLLWSMGLFCLLCLLQALGKNPLSLYPEGQSFYDGYGKQYQGAYAGSVGNVDLVSALLALVIPLLVIPALGKQLRRTWPCWLLALGCVGLLVWLRVLCGLVGLAAGTALTLLVRCPDEKRKWLLLSYGILAVTGIALLWAVDLPVKFLHELHEILHGRAEDSFGTGRFFIWRQMNPEPSAYRGGAGYGPVFRPGALCPPGRVGECGLQCRRQCDHRRHNGRPLLSRAHSLLPGSSGPFELADAGGPLYEPLGQRTLRLQHCGPGQRSCLPPLRHAVLLFFHHHYALPLADTGAD